MLELVSVYSGPEAKKALYELLGEREPHQNISHRRMPSYEEHCAFVDSRPYKDWCLIKENGAVFGAVYLSKMNEIGLQLFKKSFRKGIGSRALEQLFHKHPDVKCFLANVNPSNAASIAFFRKFKFKHIQNTYELIR